MTTIDSTISAAFRAAFESHPQREPDPALAVDSARETASALVPDDVHGDFDDETLTFHSERSNDAIADVLETLDATPAERDAAKEYQVYENGQIVIRIEAASARGALRAAARKLPRHAADYNMVPSQDPWWCTWRACLPGEQFEAECQVLIPATGTLRGAGRNVYRTYVAPEDRGCGSSIESDDE
jgi:hypothetical protein